MADASIDVPTAPCSTCPYRRDTPPGIWAPDEYEKLPAFDAEPPDGPDRVFLCHHTHRLGRETVCRGWLAVHPDSMAVRLAIVRGELPPAPWPDVAVELYASGQEARDAGLVDGPPDPDAFRAQVRLLMQNTSLTITELP